MKLKWPEEESEKTKKRRRNIPRRNVSERRNEETLCT